MMTVFTLPALVSEPFCCSVMAPFTPCLLYLLTFPALLLSHQSAVKRLQLANQTNQMQMFWYVTVFYTLLIYFIHWFNQFEHMNKYDIAVYKFTLSCWRDVKGHYWRFLDELMTLLVSGYRPIFNADVNVTDAH